MQPDEAAPLADLSRGGLARLYAVCEDADAELGSLAADLASGQLRSLVADALGRLSALQWYAVRRLGGVPGHEGEPGAIDWAELWALADGGRSGAAGT
jgi:hypothetical protein